MDSSTQVESPPQLRFTVHGSGKPPLVLAHAQGTDSHSFDDVMKSLTKDFTVYAVDCFGHGESAHDTALYNVVSLGDALVDFIECEIGEPCAVLGHSSGDLIAAYAAGRTPLCEQLILEDPPFFSSQGERRKRTFNYVDLSSICHRYLLAEPEEEFVLYYFENQYAWRFFPERMRDKVRHKSIEAARRFLAKHPEQDLKVPFWPKSALASYIGMGLYDPRFGQTFYDGSFHADIPHEQILSEISCPTLFMKAKTEWSDEGILLAALDEDDLNRCLEFIEQVNLVRFDCRHGIHIEKPKEFVRQIERFISAAD